MIRNLSLRCSPKEMMECKRINYSTVVIRVQIVEQVSLDILPVGNSAALSSTDCSAYAR
jgi:hypothetical protein